MNCVEPNVGGDSLGGRLFRKARVGGSARALVARPAGRRDRRHLCDSRETKAWLSRRRPIDLAAVLREHHAVGPTTGIRAVTNVASQIVAVATEADYRIDPTRWGSAAVAAHFPGFRHLDIRTSGATIRLRHGGSGPPLLLVHGNPQNHTCWYKVAAKARRALPRRAAGSAGLWG